MRILLFDIHITGHHSEYISHLVDYISDLKDPHQYFFVVHPLFLQKFPHIHAKSSQHEHIKWIEISQEEVDKCYNGGLASRSLSSYRVVNQYASKVKADHVVLLSINVFQLALSLFRSPYTISGILFKQFARISKKGNAMRYYRKYFQTLLFTLNQKITQVFILNDDLTVGYLNKEFKTPIFKVLSDPIPELQPLDGFDIYKEYNISRDKKIFLHIGSLDERKGTVDILDALGLIPSNIRKKIFVLLIGKGKGGIGDKINKKIEDLDLNTLCYWDDSFVTNEKMKSLFEQCECVLIPYKNHEASSGILGHAAASNKRVIGPSSGLLGELINAHNLGITIKECSPRWISEAIIASLTTPFVINKQNIEFVQSHRPDYFSETVLAINVR